MKPDIDKERIERIGEDVLFIILVYLLMVLMGLAALAGSGVQ